MRFRNQSKREGETRWELRELERGERGRPTTTPPSLDHLHNLATTHITKHFGIHHTHGYITPTRPNSHNTHSHSHNNPTWWCHHKPSPVRRFKPKPSPPAPTRSALSGLETSSTGWTRIIPSPHITFLRAFYSFSVSGFWSVRLCCVLCFVFFLLCSLGVWFIVSETSLSEWLFCCIPFFFSILFIFLLSFGRENFMGFTLRGARRRVSYCSYPWIWCLHISDLSVLFYFILYIYIYI